MNADVTVEIENDTLGNEGEKWGSDGIKTVKKDFTALESVNCLRVHAPVRASVLHWQIVHLAKHYLTKRPGCDPDPVREAGVGWETGEAGARRDVEEAWRRSDLTTQGKLREC